jgi:hypothetical protein
MKELLNKLKENGMIWHYLGALISADNLSNVEDCDRSIMLLNDTIKAMPETEFSDDEIKKIIQYCKDGIEICEHDKKLFLTNIN